MVYELLMLWYGMKWQVYILILYSSYQPEEMQENDK